MSIRNKLFLACESFLRVPPLILIDEIFRTSFGIGGSLFKHGASPGSPTLVAQTVILNSKNTKQWDSFEESEGLTNSPLQSNLSESNYETIVSSNVPNNNASIFSSFWALILESYATLQNNSLVEAAAVEELKITQDVQNNSTDLFHGVNIEEFSALTEEFAGDLMICGEVVASLVLFLAAVVMFMLATENLIKLYSYLISFLTLYIAYITTPIVVSWSLNGALLLSINLFIRTVLAISFFACRAWPTGYPIREERTGFTSLLDPLLLSMFYLSGAVNIPPLIYIMVTIGLHHSLIVSLPKVYKFLLLSWGETKRVQNEYGLSHLIQVESGRLRINTVFRLFWMTRAAYDAFYRCCDEPFSLIIRYVMTHGTETFTGIVGLTVTVAAICHQIGDFLLWILYFGTNNEVDANRFGSISTVLFFILSLQSGLTSLDPEKRLDRLMKNIVLLGTALFHALHQMVAPLLHAFRTFQAVQIRAASISCAFLCVSVFLTFYLLRWSTISTWSLAVLALAIEFKIKVVISLIISLVVYLSQLVQYPEVIEKFVSCCRRILPRFVMHFFDQLYDQISHEDMVFYLKTVANVAEFITGIFLFVNAVWIFLFESTSAIRAIGMSIHAYFNIWCEAQKGFRIYCQRKTASKKIMSLADATDDQLRGRSDDVCSICYEGFESAKVTNCGHLFHAVCLRKWLYVQNTCPMCHEILYREEIIGEIQDAPAAPPPNNVNPVAEIARNDNLSDSEADELDVPNVINVNGNPFLGQNVPNPAANNAVVNIRHRRLTGMDDAVRLYDVEGNETDMDESEDNSSSDAAFDLGEDNGSFELEDDLNVIDIDVDDDDDVGDGLQAHNSRGLVVFL